MYNSKHLKVDNPSNKNLKNPSPQVSVPFESQEGFMNGLPPEGHHYRILGDTLFNPTPFPITAVANTGQVKKLLPFDTTNVSFDGADYVDEYLTEDEIEEYRKGGYIIEDLPKAQWGTAGMNSGAAFFGGNDAMSDAGPTTAKVDAILQEKEKQKRIQADKVKAVQSGDVEEYYSHIKDPEKKDKIVASAEMLANVGVPNDPENNWGDSALSEVHPETWFIGGAGALSLARPLLANRAINTALQGLGAYDMVTNTVPNIRQNWYDYHGAKTSDQKRAALLKGVFNTGSLALDLIPALTADRLKALGRWDKAKPANVNSPWDENVYTPKTAGYGFKRPLKVQPEEISTRLDELRSSGKYWDKQGIPGNELLHDANMVNYKGTYHGRPIVEVTMPDGSPQFFYKSSGWAGKKGTGVSGTTEGQWQVYGGHSNHPMATDNWFIKDKDYQNFYGSRTYNEMANSLDNALMRKFEISDPGVLDQVLNFKNINKRGDDFVPDYQEGGCLECGGSVRKYQDTGEVNYDPTEGLPTLPRLAAYMNNPYYMDYIKETALPKHQKNVAYGNTIMDFMDNMANIYEEAKYDPENPGVVGEFSKRGIKNLEDVGCSPYDSSCVASVAKSVYAANPEFGNLTTDRISNDRVEDQIKKGTLGETWPGFEVIYRGDDKEAAFQSAKDSPYATAFSVLSPSEKHMIATGKSPSGEPWGADSPGVERMFKSMPLNYYEKWLGDAAGSKFNVLAYKPERISPEEVKQGRRKVNQWWTPPAALETKPTEFLPAMSDFIPEMEPRGVMQEGGYTDMELDEDDINFLNFIGVRTEDI